MNAKYGWGGNLNEKECHTMRHLVEHFTLSHDVSAYIYIEFLKHYLFSSVPIQSI